METAATIIARYAEVRQRLRNLPSPAPSEAMRRLVRIRAQPHHPDYVPPALRLPTVIITEETKQRVHDILVIAQEARNFAPEPGYWREIVEQVCAKHGITPAELTGARRAVHISAARQEAVYRMSRETNLSLPQIGKRIGGRDHTTIIHSIRRHEAKLRGEVYRQPRYGQAAEAISQ